MSILGVLIRFLLAYIVLMVVALVALHLFGITSKWDVSLAILIGAVGWSCSTFGKKNGRYFNSAEKTKVVCGVIGIDLAVQFFVAGGVLAAEGKLNAGAFIVALALVGVFHSVAIYYFVGSTGKWFEKQRAKKAATGG